MVPLVEPAGTTRAGVGSEADADIVATGLSLTTLADGSALCLTGVALALLVAPSNNVAGDEAQPTRTTAASQTAADAAAPTFAHFTKRTWAL